MNTLRVKPLTLALIASFAVAQAACAAVEPRLHEDVEVTPGRSVTPADEQILSFSAASVLHHIARARDDLRKKDGDAAKQELGQAETLLDIIQSAVPTTMVKSRVWTADDKLKYENSEEIPAVSVPIYANLDARTDFDAVKLGDARSPEKANPNAATRPEAAPAAARETEAREASLYFEELDLPLNATRHFVSAARTDLSRNRFAEAEQALRAAQGNLDYVSVYLPDPLLAARINLERAENHYGAGRIDDAKADVSRAIAQLGEAEKQADTASQADVKQILGEAQSLNARMDKNEPGLKTAIRGLWRRAAANADRALAYTSFGWARLRHPDPLRGALIEAKRYVAYADIDANVSGDSGKAKQDLQQARTWLDKAAGAGAKIDNGQDAAVYVKDIGAVVDSLLNGQAKPDKGEMANLKQKLTQAISHS
jgi:tetratricopeptide (TPR) repeat protein